MRRLLPFLALLACACGAASGDRATIRLLYTSESRGLLFSCACSGREAGGLPRRATLLDSLRSDADLELRLDAGDYSAPSAGYGPRVTECFARGLAALSYDAVTLGERDLFHGQDRLVRERDELRLPLVTANVADIASGDLIAPAWREFRAGGLGLGGRRAGGVRVAVLGLTADNVMADLLAHGGAPMEIRPPEESLRRVLAEVRPRADVVILLAHLDPARARNLAWQVEGVDVMICGHGAEVITEPELIRETLLVQTLDRGLAVGELRLVAERGKGLVEWSGALHDLGPETPEQERMKAMLEACVPADTASAGGEQEGDRHSRAIPVPAGDPGAGGPASPAAPRRYLGAGSCRECHRAIFDSWEATPHARAFAALESKGKTGDAGCVGCHTTGYGRGNGFRTLEFTPAMVNVQCEECHGPGAQHVALRRGAPAGEPLAAGEISRAGGAHACVRCHNAEQDPGFDFASERERGSHALDGRKR